MIDGHVGLVLGGAATYLATINSVMPKGWLRRFAHQEPVVFGGIALGCVAVAMPLSIIPVRRALGMPTNNYEPQHPGTKYPARTW
ncbi:hypothetical protein TrLO_g8854 [Triparma laevis f. longispina]|uniref:Uncharacterized protein n=1 Tax=Triparma laevis f. longispina TaxID=1714387 RepID=A0A9W7A8J5_9STRA|nr:hypothetical protein TrLO_g8854 [Triparma laevis f. longispina]